MFFRDKSQMVSPQDALLGRSEPIPGSDNHFVNGTSYRPPFPDGMEQAMFGMGCFWGAERIFWQIPGVYTTAAGYSAGYTPNPTYEEVCTGRTGHNEVVLVVYDPNQVTYERLLKDFWEQHDPTQGMRQGNDRGTQYRSGIYPFTDKQLEVAKRSADRYQELLDEMGFGKITTEIVPAGDFYYAEDYHQQYLAKNPGGYCNHGFCQVSYQPVTGAAGRAT
jgi:peptide-methionine (S)-S-oxide reductase